MFSLECWNNLSSKHEIRLTQWNLHQGDRILISSGQGEVSSKYIEVSGKKIIRADAYIFKDQRLRPNILRETFGKSSLNISRLLSRRKMYLTI